MTAIEKYGTVPKLPLEADRTRFVSGVYSFSDKTCAAERLFARKPKSPV